MLNSDDERRDMLDFFASLPLLLSRPDLRVTHAAWHAPSVEYLAEHLPSRPAAATPIVPSAKRPATE